MILFQCSYFAIHKWFRIQILFQVVFATKFTNKNCFKLYSWRVLPTRQNGFQNFVRFILSFFLSLSLCQFSETLTSVSLYFVIFVIQHFCQLAELEGMVCHKSIYRRLFRDHNAFFDIGEIFTWQRQGNFWYFLAIFYILSLSSHYEGSLNILNRCC